jgi:hypothetical protein
MSSVFFIINVLSMLRYIFIVVVVQHVLAERVKSWLFFHQKMRNLSVQSDE